MTKRLTLILTFCLTLSSCMNSKDGFAPSVPAPTPASPTVPIAGSHTIIQKNGHTVATASGWVIDEDHSTVIQKKALSSGWEIEAQYE